VGVEGQKDWVNHEEHEEHEDSKRPAAQADGRPLFVFLVLFVVQNVFVHFVTPTTRGY
jgi:hypothetical protein